LLLDLRVCVGLLLESLSLVEDFLVLLKGLFGGFGQVETDFFGGISVFVGLSLDPSV
jgi:hypothetical protein